MLSMLTKVWKEIGRVSVVEVLNSNNLAESPRPRSNIKAHVWSPQQLSGEIQTYNLGYSRVLTKYYLVLYAGISYILHKFSIEMELFQF